MSLAGNWTPRPRRRRVLELHLPGGTRTRYPAAGGYPLPRPPTRRYPGGYPLPSDGAAPPPPSPRWRHVHLPRERLLLARLRGRRYGAGPQGELRVMVTMDGTGAGTDWLPVPPATSRIYSSSTYAGSRPTRCRSSGSSSSW
jgi:hypothetical protein